jgi:hypothetical protein
MTAERLADADFEMTEEAARAYRQYVESHHGEIEVKRLAQAMWTAGGRSAIQASVRFMDIGGYLRGIEGHLRGLTELWERLA